MASTPAPTAAHTEEAAHRRELWDLLATQAALIDEASREARQLAAALDGTEAARCAPMSTARASGFGQLALHSGGHSLSASHSGALASLIAISRLGRAGLAGYIGLVFVLGATACCVCWRRSSRR